MGDVEQYQLLPALGDDDYGRLRADIAERGVMVPIEVDEDGRILDGHHRQRIATELGVDCPQVVRRGMAEHEKRLHAVSLNLSRRHLTDAQKVIVGRQIEPDVALRAEARMLAGKALDPEFTCTQGQRAPQTRDEVAAQVGIGSGLTYERHKKVLDEAEKVAPEVATKAEAGELTMREVAKATRQAKREAAVAELNERADDPTEYHPIGDVSEFPCIVIDPPWRYDNVATRGAAEDHYPTMSLDELAALELPATDNAHLYLWVTNSFLRDGFDLMETWGFTYKTCLTWVKPQIGLGNYFRNSTEHVLFGVRGSLPTLANNVPTWFQADRTRHSAKPMSFYDLVEKCSPGPYMEMFARARRFSWHTWGNEA
jgi:N6-adenosine-specific RNA methylase IME4/ParB-like chromosome segregation protein Spo0J